jgi:hypothetical protein
VRIGPVLVVDSWFIEGPKALQSHYIIDVQPPQPPWAPRTRLITRDRGLYSDCLGVEGLKIPVLIGFSRVGDQNVLEWVELAEKDS